DRRGLPGSIVTAAGGLFGAETVAAIVHAASRAGALANGSRMTSAISRACCVSGCGRDAALMYNPHARNGLRAAPCPESYNDARKNCAIGSGFRASSASGVRILVADS